MKNDPIPLVPIRQLFCIEIDHGDDVQTCLNDHEEGL